MSEQTRRTIVDTALALGHDERELLAVAESAAQREHYDRLWKQGGPMARMAVAVLLDNTRTDNEMAIAESVVYRIADTYQPESDQTEKESFDSISDPKMRERLASSYDRSSKVYGKYAVLPSTERVEAAWLGNSQLQAGYDAMEAADMKPAIILSRNDLPVGAIDGNNADGSWQAIFRRITEEQPEGAPNQLNEYANGSAGLYFKGILDDRTGLDERTDPRIYSQQNSDQTDTDPDTDGNWEITVMPTKGGYEDSGITDTNTTYTDAVKNVGKDKLPTIGALLTYYAQALQNQESVPENIWTWAAETDGSRALDIGFHSGLHQVSVGQSLVSIWHDARGVRLSVRGKI